MKIVKVTLHISILYLLYTVGNWIQAALDLFIPGSIIGMVLFLILLLTNIIKKTWVAEGTELFLKHMPLYFVPATVGVINYLDLFAGKGFLLILITLFSTALVMVTSGFTAQALSQRRADSK